MYDADPHCSGASPPHVSSQVRSLQAVSMSRATSRQLEQRTAVMGTAVPRVPFLPTPKLHQGATANQSTMHQAHHAERRWPERRNAGSRYQVAGIGSLPAGLLRRPMTQPGH